MNIISLLLSLIGSSYIPIILFTLILGFVFLIINENNKFSSSDEDKNNDWKTSVSNLEYSSDKDKSNEELEVNKNNVANKSEFEKVADTDDSSHSDNEEKIEEQLKKVADTDDSSHSHNEEKIEEQSKNAVKKSKKQRGCSSSNDKTSGGCSNRKKRVEDVIILTFSNEEECAKKVLDCLEDNDISFRINLLSSDNFDIGFNKYKDAVDLCLILLTSEENIKQVESLIENPSTGKQVNESETANLSSFSYSILYINQESQDLKVLEDGFNSMGGKMWQASVTISEDKQKIDSQDLIEFADSLLKDIKKSRKKCCGTSCKKTTTDIEDLFPITTAVQT